MDSEPSVLDYLKSRLSRKGQPFTLPELPWDAEQTLEPEGEEPPPELPPDEPPAEEKPQPPIPAGKLPWQGLAALVLALAAQTQLEPPDRNVPVAVAFYALAAGLMVWGYLAGRMRMAEPAPDAEQGINMQGAWWFLLPGAVLLVGAFISFFSNRFNFLNLFFFLTGGGLVWASLWERTPRRAGQVSRWKAVTRWLRHPRIRIELDGWQVGVGLVFAVAIFYRFYHLAQTPGEMFSDHAEKLLDVNDVLNGQYAIFFERNTGREAFQFYLTALVVKVMGTGINFLNLKIGTALCGLFTLPYVYLLGKEMGSRWIGLAALLLAGIAYWPNVISRVALRFTLYPFFAAPVLYYLFRGLRHMRRNDFIWCGFWLGLGLHGYSPMRIVPFFIVLAVGLYLLHRAAQGKRWQTLAALVLLAVVALIVFLPLLSYVVGHLDMFGSRAFSRLGETERPLPGSAVGIFFSNLWKAMIMFFYSNGGIWVHSVVDRPALDVVSAALFFLGMVLLVVRYVRRRDWADLLLLVSIPFLMLPSILSLAFPEENPSLNRTGAAMIPVFVTAGIGFESLFTSLWHSVRTRAARLLVVAWAVALAAWTMNQNYTLVFEKFHQQFMGGAWNTSEMGQVIRGFADSVGTPDTAYVVPFAHWVDTRLVGINAGYPTKDYALWPEDFEKTLSEPRTKLFIVKYDDSAALEKLKQMYPSGVLALHTNPLEGKNFWTYLVPGQPAGQ